MREEGLLSHIGVKPRYRVGHVFFEISRLYGRNSTLMDLADPELAELSRATRHGGYISILDQADVLVLRVYLGPEMLRVVTPLGSRMPAFATSTGRTLLARLDNEAVRALYPEPLVPPSSNAPQDMRHLLRRLDEVRRVGWCEALDEAVAGVGSVAVSIADPQTGEMLAFCLSFPAHLVSKPERRRLAASLSEAARRLADQVDDRFWAKVSTMAAA